MNGTFKAINKAASLAEARLVPACRIAHATSGTQSQPAKENGIRAAQLDSPKTEKLAATRYACSHET